MMVQGLRRFGDWAGPNPRRIARLAHHETNVWKIRAQKPLI